MGSRKSESTMFDQQCFEQIISGCHEDPRYFFGPHRVGDNGNSRTLIRIFLPNADRAWVGKSDGAVYQEMRRVHPSGLFQYVGNSNTISPEDDRYRVRYSEGGEEMQVYDPYSFEPLMSDLDLFLFGEGNHDADLRAVGGA